MKRLLFVTIFFACIGLMVSCNSSNSNNSSESKDNKEKVIFNSKEDVKKYIEGKTWTYTGGSAYWLKLYFENGKEYLYVLSNPSDKSWGEPMADGIPYEIKESWRDGEMDGYLVFLYLPTDKNVEIAVFDPAINRISYRMMYSNRFWDPSDPVVTRDLQCKDFNW